MSKSTKPRPAKKCPVTIGFNLDGKAKAVYCGQWTCPGCAARLAKKWAARVKRHIAFEKATFHAATGDYPQDYWFITLTLGSRYRTVEQGFDALPALWKRLHQQMKRHKADWQYVAFVEGQPQRGYMPHFHIISNQPLPVKRNKHGKITKHATHDYAHKMGWGFEAEQEQVSGSKNAGYIAKYSSKQSPKTPKGFRRVRPSQGWQKLDKDPLRRLIVKGRGEGLADFLERVTEATDLTYAEAYVKFVNEWENHKSELGPIPRYW